jgi:predicted TIM-barrel fold metal-dependent hydrolase
VPFVIERLDSILTVHAFTHPVGAMLALTSFTVGGVLHRFPRLRVGFMEAGTGWLPFWLERLDEHWEHVPDQAPQIDRAPSEYFLSGNCFAGCEPGERMLGYIETQLPGVACYASDYCHWDCAFPDTVRIVHDRRDLDGTQKENILSRNASRLYGIAMPAAV